MAEVLEVMSSEDSAGTDVSFDVNTFVEGAPSASRSWKRILLVAVPFCVVAFGYIAAQVVHRNDEKVSSFQETAADSNARLKGKLEQGRINALSTLQSLTGKQFGRIIEVSIETVPLLAFETTLVFKDTPASEPFPTKLVFDPPYHTPSLTADVGPFVQVPTAVDALHRLEDKGSDAGTIKDQRVRLGRKWMMTLLGSHGQQQRTEGKRSHVVSSVFGAWFGGSPAAAAALRESETGEAKGWLSKELLHDRVYGGKEPLVLDEELQERVLAMGTKQRAEFLQGIKLGRQAEGGMALSACAVTVSLYRLVRGLTDKGVATVLEFDDLFEEDELAAVFDRLWPERQQPDGLLELSSQARLASLKTSVASPRRSGPRFFLWGLLLVEEMHSSLAGSEMDDQKVAERLPGQLKVVLKGKIREALEKSTLKLLRRGTMQFEGESREQAFRRFKGRSQVEMGSLIEFLQEHVANEQAV